MQRSNSKQHHWFGFFFLLTNSFSKLIYFIVYVFPYSVHSIIPYSSFSSAALILIILFSFHFRNPLHWFFKHWTCTTVPIQVSIVPNTAHPLNTTHFMLIAQQYWIVYVCVCERVLFSIIVDRYHFGTCTTLYGTMVNLFGARSSAPSNEKDGSRLEFIFHFLIFNANA